LIHFYKRILQIQLVTFSRNVSRIVIFGSSGVGPREKM